MLQFTVTETNTEGNPPIGTTNKGGISFHLLSCLQVQHIVVLALSHGLLLDRTFLVHFLKSSPKVLHAASLLCFQRMHQGGRSDGSLWESAATLHVNYSRSVKSSIRRSIETGCLGLSVEKILGWWGKGGSRDSGGRWKECSSYRELQSLLVSVITNLRVRNCNLWRNSRGVH